MFLVFASFSVSFRIYINKQIKRIFKYKNSNENINQHTVEEHRSVENLGPSLNEQENIPTTTTTSNTMYTSLPNIQSPCFDYEAYKARQLRKQQVRNRLLDSFNLTELKSVAIHPPSQEELEVKDVKYPDQDPNVSSSSSNLSKDKENKSTWSSYFFNWWTYFSFDNASS